MKKILLIILILCFSFTAHAWNPLLVSPGVVGAAPASYLFFSDWDDSGATDEVCSTNPCPDTWDSMNDVSGQIAVDGALYYGASGDSIQYSVTSTNNSKVNKDLGAANEKTTYWVRFYVYFNDVTAVDSAIGVWGALYIYDASGGNEVTRISFVVDGSGNLVTMRATYTSDAGTGQTSNMTISPSINTWYEVKLQRVKSTGVDAADGILKTWFGTPGAPTLGTNLSNIDDDTVGGLQFFSFPNGFMNWATDNSTVIHVDQFSVAETEGGLQ